MRLLHLSPLFAAFLVSGCAIGRPDFIDESFLPLDMLVQAIDCELRDAVKEQVNERGRTWFTGWQGVYTITLKANEVGGFKASSGTPILLSKTTSSLINLGIGGGYQRTATRNALFKFNINVADIIKDGQCTAKPFASTHPFLFGEIGFREWLDRALDASEAAHGREHNPEKITSVGHTFEFAVDTSGDLSPAFSITPTVRTFSITPTVSLDRTEDNIVDVVFGKVPGDERPSVTVVVRYRPEEKAERARLSEAISSEERKLAEAERQLERAQTLAPSFTGAERGTDKSREEIAAASAKKSDAQDRLRDAREKLAAIKPSRVVRRRLGAASSIPPSNNPNVAGTLTQLQLERLISSGRFGR
jgi:hypothetical protein